MAKAINSFIFLDFETGGLDARKHAVTEIAAVAVKGDTLEKINIQSTFIKPYGDYQYTPEALKATGISFEEIEGGITVEEAVNEFISLLKLADLTPRNKGSKPIICAFNSRFDKGFLLQMFDYCKKVPELENLTYGGIDYYGNYQPECLDVAHLVKLAFGNKDMVNFKLGTCIEEVGIVLSDAHKAINDTLAMKDMVMALVSKMRYDGELKGVTGVKERIRDHFQF